MIEFLRGEVRSLSPTDVVIDVGGIGLSLSISLTTFDCIRGLSEVQLLVYEQIKEDSWTLFGFASEEERRLFMALISVSSVGAQTARIMLSSMAPQELAGLIVAGDVAALKRVKGIGAKTAERIVLELRGKVQGIAGGYVPQVANGAASEAQQALVALGFASAATEKAVQEACRKQPGATAEELIRAALACLRG